MKGGEGVNMEFEPWLIPLAMFSAEALKDFGVTGKWSILSAVLVGAALSLSYDLAPEYAIYVIRALVAGLSAAGVYRGGKRIGTAILNGRS
jgi:hypothetical protein